jgi:DNA protecting protein DprA
MNETELVELLFLASNGIGVVTLSKLKNLAHQKCIHLSELWQKMSTTPYRELLEKSRVLSASQLTELVALQQTFSPQSYWEYVHHKGIEVVRMNELIDQALIYEWSLPPFLFAKAKNQDGVSVQSSSLASQIGAVNKTPKIGIVGTRAMTAYGEYATRWLTQELVSQAGAIIVSGAMVGVDTVAHQTALDNNGLSIGIVGFGYDHWYPRKYQQVLARWLEQGLILLSEYPPWVAPAKGTFVQRNRLIAMLSDTTVVVEAPLKSGALITARFAMEYGKNVGAVPGHIGSPQSEGTHGLLQQGAYVVSTVQDVIRELPSTVQIPVLGTPNQKGAGEPQQVPVSTRQRAILELLTVQAYSLEALSVVMNCSLTQLRGMVIDLELAGLVCLVAGRWHITASGYDYLHRPVQ